MHCTHLRELHVGVALMSLLLTDIVDVLAEEGDIVCGLLSTIGSPSLGKRN